MSVLHLIIKELAYRKVSALLSVAAILTAAGLFVFYFTTAEASRRETVRVTRDLGFNLRIIPKDTDMDQFWATGFSDRTLPEEAVGRLANYEQVFFAYNHLVASLQRKWTLAGKEVLLTGLAPAITAPGQKKQPMGYSIKPGTVILGCEVARRLAVKKGDTLRAGDKSLKVEQCLAESGTEDDIRVFTTLSDAQELLHLEGQINEIKAIDCLCLTADQDPLQTLRAELTKALPEAKVIQLRALADGRARQRQMTDKYAALLGPVVLVVCAAWVAVLAMLNVRERKSEIGICRALGYGSGSVAALFLVKAVVLGLLGGALGYLLGTWMALKFGPEIFPVTANAIQADPRLLRWALLGAPCFAALSSLVPTIAAVVQDPAESLRED